VTEKQRIRMLLAGSFGLALHISGLCAWPAMQINPNAMSQAATFTYSSFYSMLLWGFIYFSLRPLIPADKAEISN